MAIKLTEAADPSSVLDGLLWLMVAGCLVYVVTWFVTTPWSRLRSAHRLFPTRSAAGPIPGSGTTPRSSARVGGWRVSLWALGLFGASSVPAAAQRRMPDAPSRRASEAPAPPWSATSGFPPPRPLVRIGALDAPRADERALEEALESGADARAFEELPAAGDHARGRSAPGSGRASDGHESRGAPPLAPNDATIPVFPRHPRDRAEGRSTDPSPERERERTPRDIVKTSGRDAVKARHPAGKARQSACDSALGPYVVVPGDTLWDIAARALRTDDPARIARYWPTIHRANREVIGPDPSLIFPGSVLHLPIECTHSRR